MQRNINFMSLLLLAACWAIYACNKNTEPAPVAPIIPPSQQPDPPDPQYPSIKVCKALGVPAAGSWGSNAFWLNDVLRFEPQVTDMKDTAGYWLLKAEGKNNERLHLCFRKRPGRSWMYYVNNGYPLSSPLYDTCAMAVAYSLGSNELTSHFNLIPPDHHWDEAPVYVTKDSIYVRFEASYSTSTGGPSYKIAGRLRGKKNY
jgi:hypothetical protein